MPTALDSLSLPARVAQACRTDLGLSPGDGVLVAVSAGADSTALASLLQESAGHGLPLRLVLGHVDHGWRGPAEAEADRRALAAVAARLRLPLCLSPPPPAGQPRSEDAARRWRYRRLAAMAREHECRHVATGHHAGDQAETLLMRLLRGSGLVGLAGIPRRRPLHPDLVVLRPLLDVEPDALRAHLRERGLAWREDPTNRDVSRDRAAMRARLERRHAPALAALAARLRRRLERRLAHIEDVAAHAYEPHACAGAVAMPRAALAELQGEDLALALRLAGERLGADRAGPWFVRRHVARFRDLLERGGELDLPRGLFLHVSGKTAWLAWRAQPPVTLPRLERRDLECSNFDLAGWQARADASRVAVDADVLGAEPELRLLAATDVFTPHGSTRERSVTAWLSRCGVPHLARRGQLVVVGRRGVAWVVGRRLDGRHAVVTATARVALLALG